MADEKDIPNVNVFSDTQVLLMTQAVAIVATILTKDKKTYDFALRAFKNEMKRRGVDNAADEMNLLMKLGGVVGKRLGYETFTAETRVGRLNRED